MNNKRYYVYIVRCKKGALYTGFSTNVEKRVETHNKGKGAKCLKMLGLPVSCECKIEVGSIGEALSLEYRIKKMKKVEKEAFILEKNNARVAIIGRAPDS